MVVEGEYYDGPCKLLELPHDVLRILFSYLDATSLYHLSRTCNYLEEFILDPLLWKYVDARHDPNVCDKIHYCVWRVHKKTTHLYLKGNLCPKDLPDNFFGYIKPFDNLAVLALENIKLNGSKISLVDFPSGLEELSLKRTYVKNSTHFFQHTVRNMPKLRVLILDECSWVTCSFLLSVAKYEHLEIISIVKCLQVHINMVPYLNVAKLGCKKLKVFDCRFTGIGGELLRTFYSKPNLQRLYFQSFASAKVDYNENVFDYIKKFEKREGDDMSIMDQHLRDYLSTTAKPKNEIDEVFDSVLYRDPYPECVCGSEGFKEDLNMTDKEDNIPDKDLIHFSLGQLEYRFICGKHLQDIIKLPPDFKNFCQQQLGGNWDSDSSTDKDDDDDDDENESCCHYAHSYVSATISLPNTHDRTPSVREEMTLPNEGARNQSFPGVIVFNSQKEVKGKRKKSKSSDNSLRLSVQDSVSKTNAGSSSKRSHTNNESDDAEATSSKKPKRNENAFESLQHDAQEQLIDQLIESADDISSRINEIMTSGVRRGFDRITNRHRTRQENPRRIERENQPSTSRDTNGVSPSESTSSVNIDAGNSPSCSKANSSERDKNGNSNSVPIHIPNPPRIQIRLVEDLQIRRNVEDFDIRHFGEIHNYIRNNAPDGSKIKWKIPLRRLSLRGYKKISDNTLNYLKNLDIELIDLTYTSVSKKGIESFLVHNPNCRVIHPLYCVCKPNNTIL